MGKTVKDINRLKVVLVENKRTNKRLAEQLGHDPGYHIQMVYECGTAKF